MSTKQLLLIGNYGAGNLGDDAILTGLVTELRAQGFDGEILASCGPIRTQSKVYKELTKTTFAPSGLRSLLKQGRGAPKEWKTVQAAILGGGGLFVDEESWRAPWIWREQARALKIANIPYIGLGQSIGQLKPWNEWALKDSLLGAQNFHVRDQESFARIEKYKSLLRTKNRPSLYQGTDFALHLAVDPRWKKSVADRENIALIHLRRWPGYSDGDLSELYNTLVNQITDRGLKPILMTLEPYNVNEVSFLRTLDRELFVPHSVEECLEALGKARLTIGMRLHGTLLSTLVETPTVALSYSDKVENLVKQFQNLAILKNINALAFPTEKPVYLTPERMELNKQVLRSFIENNKIY